MTKLEQVLERRVQEWEHYAQTLQKGRNAQQVLKRRLLKLLAQVEICRGKGVLLQPAEKDAVQMISQWMMVLKGLHSSLEELVQRGEMFQQLKDSLVVQRRGLNAMSIQMGDERHGGGGMSTEFTSQAKGLLENQKMGLESLKGIVQKDARELKLIQESIASLS